MKRAIFLLFLLIVLFLPVCVYAEIVYQVIDLGTIGGGESLALSINDHGQIVGGAQDSSGNYNAALFDPTGNGNNINFLGGNDSFAFSINNNEQIVGWSRRMIGIPPFVTTYVYAKLYDPTGAGNNIYLGNLAGNESYAYSINDAGQIVGSTEQWLFGNTYAVIFDPTGNSNDIYLGSIPGFQDSVARSINDNMQVVGYGINLQKPAPGTTPARDRALLFDSSGSGDNIILGTLPGYPDSQALSINDSGQIVGNAHAPGGMFGPILGYYRATLFDPSGDGNNIDLGTLGGDSSEALSINELGQIAGWAENSSDDRRATLFDPIGNGNNIDLNTLIDPASGWILEYAYCINNSGWIVGQGRNPEGYRHAYLLTPEPATLALLGLGALFLRKRRK